MSEGLHNFWLILSKPDNVPIILMIVGCLFYSWLGFKQARRNDRKGIYEATQSDKVQVWPYLVKIEFLVTIIVLIVLTVWAITINAPLEEGANPTLTPNPSKAPWYFLWLQELVASTTIRIGGFSVSGGFIGGILVPGVLL